MLSPPASHTPPSSGPDSMSVTSTPAAPPPPPNSVASFAPAFTAPPPPPPTEASVRARRTTLTHRRRSDSISRRSNPPPFGDYLARIHEESPGSFFEAHTDVPDNTPKTSHAGASTCSSPRSDRTNLQPTVLNLPQIIERLEQLPPPAASRFSSPPSSVTGESSVGEPLMMAASRRIPLGATPKTNPSSPLSTMKESQGGVREHSDWANDIVQDIGRDLSRLANLAVDDNKRDPTKSIHDHYKFRLNLLLNDNNQKIMYGNVGEVPLPLTADPATPSTTAIAARRPPSVHANYVHYSEFKDLKDRVEDLNRLVKQLTDMHSYSQKEINALKTDVTVLKKAVAGSSVAEVNIPRKENDASKII